MNRPIIQKYNHVRSKKLTRSAKGIMCKVMTPACNYNPETSVLAHLDSMYHGKSTGIKADDSAAAICCSDCHDFLSLNVYVEPDVRYTFHAIGVFRTWGYWLDYGILLTDRPEIQRLSFIDINFQHDAAIKKFSNWIREGVIKIA